MQLKLLKKLLNILSMHSTEGQQNYKNWAWNFFVSLDIEAVIPSAEETTLFYQFLLYFTIV